ncbi:hypothetical protein DL768_010290 [Monosporascus sp. mg162]|nr:hypothetical protein DL768_010290 [Monosporascus sp. mg162]
MTICSVVLNTTLAPSELSPAKLTTTTAAINGSSSNPALSNETTGSPAETSTDPPQNEAEGVSTSDIISIAIGLVDNSAEIATPGSRQQQNSFGDTRDEDRHGLFPPMTPISSSFLRI